MFSSINVSVLGAVDTLTGYLAAKCLDFQGWFKPRFAACKEPVRAHTERARIVVQARYDRARVAVAPAVAVVVGTVRERLVALLPPFRLGFTVAASLPVAFRNSGRPGGPGDR